MEKGDLTNDRKIDELIELTRENNKILHDLLGRARWALFFRIVYWSVILISILGTYYYLLPYADDIKGYIISFGDFFKSFSSSGGAFSETEQIKRVFESFKNTN